ncbi:helicase C-terminal domain-containing protein [Hymenobacter saemangeumensis]
MPANAPVVRVAIAHVVSTGPYQSEQAHGLVHVGLLPVTAGGQVQDWIINPERKFSGQFGEAIGFDNTVAKAAPTWAEQAGEIQQAFGAFDALLVLDRAGQPSPEREWLEGVVLAGMDRTPVCVALDVLLAFFLPGKTLDDADDLKEAVLLPDLALQAECGYDARKPQLPFLLHTMRRALRQVLAAVLRPEPWRVVDGKAQEWLPVHELLQKCVGQPGARLRLRPFRLLALLAQQPTCCDPAPSSLLVDKPLPPLTHPAALPGPEAPGAREFKQVLAWWLQRWRKEQEGLPGAGGPAAEPPSAGRVDEGEVTRAFAELAVAVADSARKSGDKTAAWQPRPAQQAYARFVTQAINENGIYALEAGTGTGKTFGYLVPALEYLRCHSNGLVVVATSTKNLQEQMLDGELPTLLRPKGKLNERYKSVRVAMLKGKNCYLCADALADAFQECFAPEASWQHGLSWLYLALRLRDTKGDIENTAQAVEAALTLPQQWRSVLSIWRSRVAADRACRHADNGPRDVFAVCVYEAHRLCAEQAHLLVVNHHKLAVLPRRLLERQGRICIIDEADRFPDNYRSAMATEVNARELVSEAFYKLIGKPLSYPKRRYQKEDEADATDQLDDLGLLGRARERLDRAFKKLWVEAGFDRLGSPQDENDVAALEEWDEARLNELLSGYALHQQVADIMADTPAAVDAQATANAAFEAYEKHKAAQMPRRAAWRALQAIRQQRAPIQHCLELLPVIGQQFQGSQGQAARLPFPLGRETHWLDSVRLEMPTGPAHFRSYYWELRDALLPLQGPLTATAQHLACLRDAVPVALQLQQIEKDEEAAEAQQPDLRLRRQLNQIAGMVEEAAQTLAHLLAEGRKAAHVPVVERLEGEDASFLGWRLGRAPYNLQPYLEGPLMTSPNQGGVAPRPFFDQFSVTLFTSATIYVEKSTRYFQQQLNLSKDFKAELCLAPAFDYFDAKAEYVAGLLPHYLPAFDSGATSRGKEQWRQAQLKTLLPLLVAFGGRTLVLFTSREEMDYAAERLRPHLARHDIELLVQQGTSQWQIRRFRRVEQSVLLGVERMWTGVDFAGPTLAQVVVWRLPMPSFGDPLVCHRKLHEPKATFWDQFYYPNTRLKLRQGFGRLVRRAGDRGALVMLDARANQDFYHHLLSEVHISPFVSLSSAEALCQHLTKEVLVLIPGLKTDFVESRELTAKKLAALVPDTI